MREILFRGKRIDNGEWVEGYLYVTHTGEYEIGSYNAEVNIERYTSIVDPATVGQYTGLTDKNGKRIFEGDIIKWCPSFGIRKDVVGFEDGGFTAGTWFLQAGIYVGEFDGTVIGNVTDNPELLGGNKDG